VSARKPWLSVARVFAAIMQEREPDYTWRPVESFEDDNPDGEPSVVEDDGRTLGERDTGAPG
jgi:hypothetical protein